MAFFDRYNSAPSLTNMDEGRMVLRAFSTDFSDEDSITSEPFPYNLSTSGTGDLCSQSLSETEHSPVIVRKKRRAPPPPSGPPPPYPSPGSLRHSYTFGNTARGSSDSESLSLSASMTASLGRNARLVYQNSTDSENVPDSAISESGQCPGSVSDQEQGFSLSAPQTPGKDKSRLWALKNALRSPNILRKSSRREDKDREREEEGGSKSSRSRKHATVEVPLSDWTFAFVASDLWEADCEFEVTRIPDYDKYLNDLVDATDPAHPDYDHLAKAASRVRNMVKEREEEEREAEEEERMDHIQERFPYDDLQLKDRDKAQTNKAKALSLRRKSAPSAVVFRSISGGRSRSSSVLWPQGTMGRKDDSLSSIRQAADPSRLYLLEDPVELARAMQTQDRYLFLLNDLLLVAKQKNADTYKLKTRVRLSEMWVSSGPQDVDEVTELTRTLDTSFVIGWPTTNFVATFRDPPTRDRWWAKLNELVQEKKEQVEPKEMSLKVALKDQNKSCEVTVGNTQHAKDVLHACLTQFSIPDSESKDYQLWVVLSQKQGSVYPLIGHETPFSIQANYLREVGRARGEEDMTLGELSEVAAHHPPSNLRCEFKLKKKSTPKKHSLEEEVSRKSMKKKKSSPLLNIFKRTGGREDKALHHLHLHHPPAPTGKLFGLPLSSVCQADDSPPKPIVDFLVILHRDGPNFLGILRKNANARDSKELRFRLDQGEQVDEEVSAVVAGGLIKDYLRSLPDPLLVEALHDEWVQVAQVTEEADKVQHIKRLLAQMPPCNLALLQRVLCALHGIQLRSEENKMNAFNLSRCIAPSLLWHRDRLDLSGAAPAVEFMIDHCQELFGPEVLLLLRDPKDLGAKDPSTTAATTTTTTTTKGSRQDSGTDSDSYHSVLSNPETGNSDSIDSLVDRELFTAEGEDGEEEEEEEDEEDGEEGLGLGGSARRRHPQKTKSHLSPSNLSRDSGLTLSDTQLYDDDSAAEHHPHPHSHPHHPHDLHQQHPHHPRSAFRACHPRGGGGGGGGGSAMHFADREDHQDLDSYHPHPLDLFPPHNNPVPPPRKQRGKRQGGDQGQGQGQGHAGRVDFGSGLREVEGGPGRGRDKRHTLHSSLSSSRLLDHVGEDSLSPSSSSTTLDSLRSARTLPSFSAAGDADYGDLGGVEEELRQYPRPPGDIGVLRKSASGAHLILDAEESLSRKCSESSLAGGVPVVFRQSSGVDSTPPHSPQSKYSYSSRDSVISDSSQGAVSRDSSVTSAPQTPDTDYADRLPPWLPALDLAARGVTFTPVSVAEREGEGLGRRGMAPHLPLVGQEEDPEEELQSPPQSPASELDSQDLSSGAPGGDLTFQAASSSPSSYSLPWHGRSREAEDVSPGPSPRIHVTHCSSKSEERLDEVGPDEATPRSSPSASADVLPLEIAHGPGQVSLPIKQMSRYSHNLAKVSPPPRVLLQSLRSPRSGKDPAPVRASHDSDIVAQVQRAGFSSAREDGDKEEDVDTESQSSGGPDGADSAEGAQGFNAAQSMEDAINDTEYIPVKPKLTIIRREESIHSNASSHSSASSVSSASSTGKSSLSSLTLSTSPSARSSSSSSGSSSITLSGDQTRPSRPPEYAEAVQRSLILKQEIPLDAEAQAQMAASRKAKSLFENSMLKYQQDHQEQAASPQRPHAARKVSDPGTTRPVSGPARDHARSVSPDPSAASLAEKSAVKWQRQRAGGKDPRQIYLESLQRYEQQQSAGTGSSGQTTKTARSASSTALNSDADSEPCAKTEGGVSENRTPDRTRQRTVHVSEVQVQLRATANRTNVAKDARPRSMLDIPSSSSSLHRSFSDSADRLNKMGGRSPPVTSEVRDSEGPGVRRPVAGSFSGEQGQGPAPVRKTSDTAVFQRRNGSGPGPSRHSVLTASCLYRPEDSPRSGGSIASPASSSPRAPSPGPECVAPRASRADSGAGQQGGRPGTRPPRSESPRPTLSRAATVDSTDRSSGRAVPSSDTSAQAAPSRDSKPRLGWSVKSLAKIYTQDASSAGGEQSSSRNPSRGGSSSSSSSHASSGSRAGPPPYQNPPPFWRLQDPSRLSSSSSSSNASSGSSTSRPPSSAKKGGPQSAGGEGPPEGEDGARWSRGRSKGGGNVSGQEAINPFTDISYV
ncbi:uncharacterized protein LOC143297570 isoform X2 [Babylonia areolata]|uniref:uncharacterized protein LOC143297570 isoform X2 n=1 Tax=Babylonia areolata TaxID=304850 RepID=UPI003FD31B63